MAADAVVHDLLIAVLLVALVMLFFLHSIRNSLIVMITIPASLVATFIGIYLMGYTLNLMSLLGHCGIGKHLQAHGNGQEQSACCL